MFTNLLDARRVRPVSHPAHLIVIAIALIAVDVAARSLPHAPNFTPVAATALFAGFLFRSRTAAVLVPLLAMAISDLVIGLYDWRIMAVVYLSLMLPACVGRFGRARWGYAILGGLTLGNSLFFFTSSNFAIWLFSGMYPSGPEGLLQCYAAALPFLRYAVQGDVLWMGVLMAVYACVRMLSAWQFNRSQPAAA